MECRRRVNSLSNFCFRLSSFGWPIKNRQVKKYRNFHSPNLVESLVVAASLVVLIFRGDRRVNGAHEPDGRAHQLAATRAQLHHDSYK